MIYPFFIVFTNLEFCFHLGLQVHIKSYFPMICCEKYIFITLYSSHMVLKALEMLDTARLVCIAVKLYLKIELYLCSSIKQLQLWHRGLLILQIYKQQ